MAVILAAGLDGIKREITPPAPIDRNIYEMTQQEREQLGIDQFIEIEDEAYDGIRDMVEVVDNGE